VTMIVAGVAACHDLDKRMSAIGRRMVSVSPIVGVCRSHPDTALWAASAARARRHFGGVIGRQKRILGDPRAIGRWPSSFGGRVDWAYGKATPRTEDPFGAG
jgi:hypothetical protein